jgi:hypothetical protein
MCEFKPGDEVVCVDDDPLSHSMAARPGTYWSPPQQGRIYVVSDVYFNDRWQEVAVRLERQPNPDSTGHDHGYIARRFRKVQRRDLQSWLKTSVPNTDHLDKPLPVKKRERAE